jgi:putative effector of murein hydrolase
MRIDLHALWALLEHAPLFWLATTLLAFGFGQAIQRTCRDSPLANPVLIAILLVALLLKATATPYQTYNSQVEFVTLLLDPATVALAVPLARNLRQVLRSFHGVGLALLAGSLTSMLSGVCMVWLLGGSRAVAFSMAPKAATTPIAMSVAQQAGGVPALAAALAIAGRIVAAVAGVSMLR